MSFENVPANAGGAYNLELANHRATIRYHCAPATPGQVHLVNDHEYQRGWLQNLSLTGVGLLLARPVATGADIVINLKTADHSHTYQLEARVIHSTRQPSGDWLVGCHFNERISEDDLDSLLYS